MVKDRLEFPLPFLASMDRNFVGSADWQVRSRQLVDTLAEATLCGSNVKIEEWIRQIDFDPEYLGTAFYMVYQFAVRYFEKCVAAEKFP